MNQGLNRQTFFIPLLDGETQLAAHQLNLSSLKSEELVPIVLIPGNMENSKIFFSKNLKGLAPFLAQNGYCVYCIDTRGKGDSSPKTSADFDYSQLDVISDLDYVYEFVAKRHERNQIWGSHSWGGVLVNCWFIRNFKNKLKISHLIHFGVKRSIHVKSFKKFLMIDIGMKKILNFQSKIENYVPPRFFGNEAESKSYIKDINRWIDETSFIDPSDGFDYFTNSINIKWPKSLYLIGAADLVLGNLLDVNYFIDECHDARASRLILGIANGFKQDYGHIDMLTDSKGSSDHFLHLLKFIN